MEIFNGRMSMLGNDFSFPLMTLLYYDITYILCIAVVGYAAQEYFTGLPVIRETPEFFYPPWTSS